MTAGWSRLAPCCALLAVDERACLAGAPERAEVTRSAQGAERFAQRWALGDAEAEQVVGVEMRECPLPATELALEFDLGCAAEPVGGCARLGGGTGETVERVWVGAGGDGEEGACTLDGLTGGAGGVEPVEDGGGLGGWEWGEEGGGEGLGRQRAPAVSEGAAGDLGECERGVGAGEDSPFVEQGEGASGAAALGDEGEFGPEAVAGDGGEPACAVLDQCAGVGVRAEVALGGEAGGAPEAGGVIFEGSVVEDGEAGGGEIVQARVRVEQLASTGTGEGEGDGVDGEVAAGEVVLDGGTEGDAGECAGGGVALAAERGEVESVAVEGDGGGAEAWLEGERGVEAGGDYGGDGGGFAIDGKIDIFEAASECGIADGAADGPECEACLGGCIDGGVEQAAGCGAERGAQGCDVRGSKRVNCS